MIGCDEDWADMKIRISQFKFIQDSKTESEFHSCEIKWCLTSKVPLNDKEWGGRQQTSRS